MKKSELKALIRECLEESNKSRLSVAEMQDLYDRFRKEGYSGIDVKAAIIWGYEKGREEALLSRGLPVS